MNTYISHHELLNILLVVGSVKSIFYLVEIENKKKTKLIKTIKLLYFFFLTIILTTWLSYSPQSSTTIFLGIYSSSFLDIIEKSIAKKLYYFAIVIVGLFIGSFYSIFGSSIKEKIIGILILVAARILAAFETKVNIKNMINYLFSFLLSIILLRIDFNYKYHLNDRIRKIHQYIRS